MTDEQIKDAVCNLFELGDDKWFDYEDEFIAFARLIEKVVKEEDARLVANWDNTISYFTPHQVSKAIRKKGE